MVSIQRRNLYYTDDGVELVEAIEKAPTLVYSTDSGIFLSTKDARKYRGANPFFYTYTSAFVLSNLHLKTTASSLSLFASPFGAPSQRPVRFS